MKEERNNTVGPHVGFARKQPRKRGQTILVAISLGSGLMVAAYYSALHTGASHKAASLGLMVSASLMLMTFFRAVVISNSSQAHAFMHGSARWANQRDIEAAGLLCEEGVYVGAWENQGRLHYLRHNGPEHVLCYAPTRSGKGVGLVIPTLLSWPQSAVILDLKGELWELSAGWRKQHAKNKVLRFDPASPTASIRFNPLEEIRLGSEYEVGDVQNLATLMVDPDGKGLNDHWQKTAQSLLVGVILHHLYKSNHEHKIANLPKLDAMLANPERPVDELWEEMTTYKHCNGTVHLVVAAAGRDMIDRPQEEAGSVLSTLKSYLSLYRDPVVAKNVSKSEFRIQDLMHHDDPVSLYIVAQPTDKARLRPLVRILINMILRLLADRMAFDKGRPKAYYKHRLLMMLDEFSSLGKLEIMQESLAFVAGYGIKCYIIIQDINQLQNPVSGYGKEESISSNCHIQAAFPPNRLETAEHLSKLTGQTTIVKEQVTTSGKRLSMMHGQVSRSFQEVQRPLLTPDESMRMQGPTKDRDGFIQKPGKMVIYCAGFPAIFGQQPLYFQDRFFRQCAEVPAPKATDKLTA